jgi:NADPH:quinone reductase-like Zn-dependent oxidoreductase
VGRDVTKFKPGNQVYAFTAFRFGAYAEYKCLPEKEVLALKPSNASYGEAAAIP